MDEKIKAEHGLGETTENRGIYYWTCVCGRVGEGDVSPEAAVDGHTAHVQELGVPKVGSGLQVLRSMHGESCEGCQNAARKAVSTMASGASWNRWEDWRRSDPWDDAELVHSAEVERVEVAK